jgi:hypothetical protein
MLFGIIGKNFFSCVKKLVGQILFCILRKPVGLDVFPKEHRKIEVAFYFF